MGSNYYYYQVLANKGYVIFCADGRGTGFKGEAFKKCTYYFNLHNKHNENI
jgi:dipeptidyl-peptidase-4